MPSVSQTTPVNSNPVSLKTSDPHSAPATNIDHTLAARPTKIHPAHPDQRSDLIPVQTTSATWNRSAVSPAQQQSPMVTHQAKQNSIQKGDVTSAQNVPQTAGSSRSMPSRSQATRHMSQTRSGHRTEAPPHSQATALRQRHARGVQSVQIVPQRAQLQQEAQPSNVHQVSQYTAHASIPYQVSQAQELSLQSHMNGAPHLQQHQQTSNHRDRLVQGLSYQHAPQHTAQVSHQRLIQHGSKHSNQMRANPSAAQKKVQFISPRQQLGQGQHMQQHFVQQTPQPGQQQQSTQQHYTHMQSLHQQAQLQRQQYSLRMAQQQPRHSLHPLQPAGSKRQFSRMVGREQALSDTVKSELDQGYQKQPSQQTPGISNEAEDQNLRAADPQRIHLSPQLQQGQQQQQLYQVGVGLPQGAVAVPCAPSLQFTGSAYANTGIFDPISLSSAGIPLATVSMGQNAPSQSVAVVRDVDRQSQHPQVQRMDVCAGSQDTERNGLIAQDLQGFVDHGQQPVVQRTAVQGIGQHDLQGHAISQHHMGPTMYQHTDQQQGTAPLVIPQNSHVAQQQGQVIMPAQAGQVLQHMSMPSGEEHFPVYQNANQVAAAVSAGLQQSSEGQGRKNVNAAAQQELFAWGAANSNARSLTNGFPHQPSADIANMNGPPGTLVTQSQLFDMGVADMRHQNGQNGTAQVAQQAVMQKTQQQQPQSLLPGVQRVSTNSGEASPRKRRQVADSNPVIEVMVSTRTFTCSGCEQEFARKRDRDAHVRTVHERSFSCNRCPARFKTKSDANRHIRIVHDRVRPYQCPSCPSMFSERNKLRRHKATVHEKLRPYVCPVCSARFGELGNLRQHTGSLHPDYQVDTAPGRTRVNNQVKS